MSDVKCPCGSGLPLKRCCGPFLDGTAYPDSAETLMRSRFTAFTRGNLPYLRKTWDPNTCPELTPDDLQTQWTRLEVLRSTQAADKAIVEFRAWYRDNGTEQAMHEISLFKLHKKRWVYVAPLQG
ncbi:YchJ family metal-binding protein [Microbulbifer thermotolerans]|uniref:YchJ family metal-binding protein n=3 Tax=Microbulbifer thermotolerans TaxID=252514 RepID=A0A143HLJ8_MICTH|nr:YchJ family metal-binding protein [Microbulbifer thermotolerans]AMX02366.1 hypothetical protein A3224_07035 [Microbulbifer thermotolerans]MCX2779987.1 YchJ family metal-binding protein [Microbulbifer thermotolerans]MCX2781816.1 YchJ family metal-binding protein [Microbulbifer thermotolerans]MCX2795157.1 YchJ family metal-binding protein [Microbulbifer thermotolerans]MCX2801814.1 YchJ family metal-binding protein [Microbulbifer thermotolerans]